MPLAIDPEPKMTPPDIRQIPAAEFSYPVDVARLKGTSGEEFDVGPDASETLALAKLFAALKLSKVRFKGAIRPFGKSEWELKGHLGATIVQSCVVTLAPVTTRIESDVHRVFLHEIAAAAAVDIGPGDDADLELLGPIIDLGVIAGEALALALPEYPRAPGAELSQVYPHPDDGTDDEVRPFEALRVLRDRLPE